MSRVSTNQNPQATQLRLSFAPSPPTKLSLELAGLTLLVSSDRPESELYSYLIDISLEPEFQPGLGVQVPARRLQDLALLGVPVTVSDGLRPLWTLVTNSPPTDLPATVMCSGDVFDVSWEDEAGTPFDVSLTAKMVSVLNYLNLPIVATDEVWLEVEKSLPVIGPSGSASLHPDGYISIQTSKPQILESSQLPGLFRTTGTSFGVCAAFADLVQAEHGIRWSGPAVARLEGAPSVPAHLVLAPHIRNDLASLVSGISLLGAKAVVWESGLGRRVLVLAALEVLDAFPAVVLCAPQSIWLWRRHVEMISRSCGLLGEHNDVQIVTYHDFPRRNVEPQAIVFDDLASAEAADSWQSLLRFTRSTDTLRFALEDSWPDDPDTAVRLMEILKPSEFSSAVPLSERYPVDPHRRLREHMGPYLALRSSVDTPDLRAFRRSSVRVVALGSAQEQAITAVAMRMAQRPPEHVLSEVLEMISAGPSNAVSPKVAAAAEIVRSAMKAGRSVAIVTRHRRTAQLMKSMLRPVSCSTLENPSPTAVVPRVPLAIIRFDGLLPDLRSFDEVLVLDYPWSFDVLERAVGPSSEPTGPDVVILHATASVDDRLAVLAARRSELGDVSVGAAPPSPSEIVYLLTPRTK